jgi:phosphoglycolate phosphatase
LGHVHRLIAFDLDGTLIDSRRDLAESANELIVERGGAPLSEEAIGLMVDEGAALLVRRALGAARLDETPDALPRFLQIYDSRLLDHTRVYDGIPDALRTARRHARVSVLTNKPARPSKQILAALGLLDLFDDVIGGDGPLPRKPDPASLIALMDRADAAPAHTLLVGDSAIDHETARRAGVRCCVTTYGFGYARFPPDRLTGDEWIVNDPSELPKVIEQFALK